MASNIFRFWLAFLVAPLIQAPWALATPSGAEVKSSAKPVALAESNTKTAAQPSKEKQMSSNENKAFGSNSSKTGSHEAILAGGCFWGVEDLIRKIPGVINTEVGYTGGSTEAPTYLTVKTGTTGHAEAVRITFDPAKVSYGVLLDHFFQLHDPTTLNQQGNDIGTQYRSVIFFKDEEQQKIAKDKIDEWQPKWKKKIVTQVVPASQFYTAEEYHQDYLQKNPGGYTCHYYRQF